MKTIVYGQVLPLDDPSAFLLIDTPTPRPAPGEVLVHIRAVSANPVDGKVRRGNGDQEPPRRLGWDAAGVVTEVGDGVSRFVAGDRVFFCGSFDNPTHAEYNSVDERLVGHLPDSVSFADAAGLPLVFLTAWQSLFELLRVTPSLETSPATLLVTAGAGGVGSAAIQLASKLTGVRVIATASRPESIAFARRMGAHHIVDHTKPLAPQVLELAPGGVDFILSAAETDHHLSDFAEAVAPMGDIAIMDEPSTNLVMFKGKSVSIHFNNVFSRSALGFNPEVQGRILDDVGKLLDRGVLQSTVTRVLVGITPNNERVAQQLVDTGRTVGKIVLAAEDGAA